MAAAGRIAAEPTEKSIASEAFSDGRVALLAAAGKGLYMSPTYDRRRRPRGEGCAPIV